MVNKSKQPGDFKIGIVDDHIQTAISISQILENEGFKTFQAYNVEDALTRVRAEKPDLLISDIKLGEDDEGYDIAKQLSQQKILFVCLCEPTQVEIKRFKNVVGFLRKPIEPKELLAMVKKALGLK